MLKSRKFYSAILAASIFASLALSAQEAIFNSNLSTDEKTRLENGEVLIRKLSSSKKLCMQHSNPVAQKAVDTIKALKPAYVAEVIRVYPYAGNENLLEEYKKSIMDVESYVGIPYYSEHGKSWHELYSSAKINSYITEGNKSEMNCLLYMEPFGDIDTKITTETSASSFYYENTNLNKLRYYDKFDCVKPQKMKSVISIFRTGDNWVVYAVGAVNAPDVFFLRDRIETSFLNRIKTFCAYFFEHYNPGK